MTDLELARQTLESDALAFALVRNGEVVATGRANGVAELIETLAQLGQQARGASLADKVVGKAVALAVVHAGIVAVHTPLLSDPAARVLEKYGVSVRAHRVVPQILNRRGDGICPMEQLTQAYADAAEGVAKLREFFAARRAEKAALSNGK